MASVPPSDQGEGSSVPVQAPKVERQRRHKFDEDGRVIEYWVDVPIVEKRKEEKPKAPTELYREFNFDEDISLGRIFPSLKGTRFDAITMKNTSMIWLGKDASAAKRAGLWFETDVEFSGLLQPAADVLSDVFGQEKPGIHLSAHLGVQNEWNDELIATGFTFRGSIEGINREFAEVVMFRNAGVMISIVPASVGGTETTWGFYGTLHLKIPNSAVPLVLDYKLDPKPDTLDISMRFGKGERWLSVFGVAGLNLDQVSFKTSIPKADVKKSLEFSITAKWSLGDVPVDLTGQVSKSGSFLRGRIQSISFNDVRKLFSSMTGGGSLDPIEQNVRFEELTIEITKGRLLLYGEVWVDSYRVAAAEVLVSIDGVSISGAIDDLQVGEGLCVKKARLELIVGRIGQRTEVEKGKAKVTTETTPHVEQSKEVPPKDPVLKEDQGKVETKNGGIPCAAIVRGTVDLKTDTYNMKFDVSAAIMKPAQGPLSFFVYGQLQCENFSIGELLSPGAMDTDHPMNLTLNKVAILACSGEGVNDYGLNVAHYPVKKGVFICAELTEINYVDKLFKDFKKEDRYVLQAGYSKDSGLSVRILLPENLRIELSPKVVSGPLTLIIDTRPSLMIAFAAVLWVTPEGQKDPLELTLSLRANESNAEAFAQMCGWWVNPLALSPRLKIGPTLTLEVEIDYSTFLATGMPSAIGFAGGFKVDDKDTYALAISLGTNPKETLVELKARCLSAGQVINLVNAVANFEMERPKEEIIRFEDVDIYASPLGSLLGTKIYPPGFVVKGKAFILGKKVEVDCSLGSTGLKLKGEVEGFSLGPLVVRGGKRVDGTRGSGALLDLEITKARQHFEVNGSIQLWEVEVSVFVLAEVLPKAQLEFNFELSWSNLLKVQVNGKLIKDPADAEKGTLGELDGADFELHAVMEQRILTSVAESMREWFKSAQVSVHEGIEDAKRKVDEVKKAFDLKVEQAKDAVAEERAIFNQKMEEAQASLREKEKDCQRERAENERWILAEEKRAAAEIQNATANLDAKKKAFEDDMEEKKRDLTKTKRDGEDAVNDKIRDLQDKRTALQRDFGNVNEALERAEARVREEEWRVREADERVNQANRELGNAAWYEAPFKRFQVGILEAERFILQCALGAAELILRGARAIIQNVAYPLAMGLVDAAEFALVAAREGLSFAIAIAQKAVDGVLFVHATALDLAKAAVVTAEKVALGIKQAACAVLDALKAAHLEVLQAARSVVKAVAEGIDFIAFQTALSVLDAVQKDTTLVDIAKAGLDAAEAVAQTALAAAAWLADRLADTLNIELIELNASLRTVANGGAFTIRVKGIILGNAFDLKGSWSPRDLIGFIVDLCKELWDLAISNVGQLFEEHQQQIKAA